MFSSNHGSYSFYGVIFANKCLIYLKPSDNLNSKINNDNQAPDIVKLFLKI
jgi:hypothetical protein